MFVFCSFKDRGSSEPLGDRNRSIEEKLFPTFIVDGKMRIDGCVQGIYIQDLFSNIYEGVDKTWEPGQR